MGSPGKYCPVVMGEEILLAGPSTVIEYERGPFPKKSGYNDTTES